MAGPIAVAVSRLGYARLSSTLPQASRLCFALLLTSVVSRDTTFARWGLSAQLLPLFWRGWVPTDAVARPTTGSGCAGVAGGGRWCGAGLIGSSQRQRSVPAEPDAHIQTAYGCAKQAAAERPACGLPRRLGASDDAAQAEAPK